MQQDVETKEDDDGEVLFGYHLVVGGGGRRERVGEEVMVTVPCAFEFKLKARLQNPTDH